MSCLDRETNRAGVKESGGRIGYVLGVCRLGFFFLFEHGVLQAQAVIFMYIMRTRY